jgi:uncharacterized protein YbjT (DUF2867 family)
MILVTGATGNNGQELVRQLCAMGQKVRALVRDYVDGAKLKGPNIELAIGDFTRPESIKSALRGTDRAFLLTPVHERFVQWQEDFIQAACSAGVKHLVKFSGMGADPEARSELLRLHHQTDQVLRNSGVPFTGMAARVTDTVHRLLGRPAVSFEQFARDYDSAFKL